MNWITDKVLPKFKALVKKENSEEVLWIKCKSCEQMIFHKEHDSNLNVCKSCGYHDFMNIENRTIYCKDNLDILKAFENALL